MSPPDHYITWLRSETNGRRFPMVTFTADTDMATMGWASLTSITLPEVVITECSAEEENSNTALETRVNAALGRSDLRCIEFSRAVDNNVDVKSLPPAEWIRRYRRPTLYYKDFFSDGEAVAEERDYPHDDSSSKCRLIYL